MYRKFFISVLSVAILQSAEAQVRLSVATDIGVQRNFKKEQKFWSLGPTLHSIFHITPKNSVYAWFAFYSTGKFTNQLTATAKLPATLPRQINYRNDAGIRLKDLSLGWNTYLKGSSDQEKGWNIYCNAGFGLMFGQINNILSVSPDTVKYHVPVLGGKAKFKRLTIDLGLGYEKSLSGDLYFYLEGRTWVPTTDYPSKFLFINEKAPFVGMLCAGIRVLF